MRVWLLAAVAALGLCGQTWAVDAVDEDIGAWVAPKYETLKAGWLHDAQGRLLYGEVKLDCAVGAGGLATDCRVKSSKPTNPELEQAALKLARLYKARNPKAISRAVLDVDVTYDEKPDWLSKPDYDQMMAVYPRQALKRGISGVAVVKCIIQTSGLTRACSVVKEDHSGLGFGPAAVVLSRAFLFKPAVKGGQPVEAEISVPVNFVTDGTPDGSGHMQDSVEAFTVLGGAVWSKTPSVAQILDEIDKKVGDKFADGKVVLQCHLDKKSGKLSGCIVGNASPGMAQFSTVAKSLTSDFQADPTVLNSVKGNVLVNLAFAFPDMSSPEWSKRYLAHPRWIKTISPDPDKATFPEAAAKAGLKTGAATVDCVVGSDGALGQCQVVSESSPNVGFGGMAVRIAEAFAANPWDDDGLPVGGAHVRMPIQMDYTPLADASAAPAPTPAAKP